MSHIFDALQRSEAERSNSNMAEGTTVTELLERAERQALLQRERDVFSGDTEGGTGANTERPPAPYVTEKVNLEKGALGIGEAVLGVERAQVFDKFQTAEISPQSPSRLVSVTDAESPAAEAFRLLGVRLRHLRQKHAFKRLLITSTVPEEGKSFAAANLACTLASQKKDRILLLEGDLRKPSQARSFGLTLDTGICSHVEREQKLTECIYQLNGLNLWLFPAGSAQGNPLDVMQSAKLSLIMEQISDWFDWVIIDSPPVLPLSDTTVWARLSDQILLVTRKGITEKRKLQRGIEALGQDKLIGALLNCSQSSAESDYYYYRSVSTASQGSLSANE